MIKKVNILFLILILIFQCKENNYNQENGMSLNMTNELVLNTLINGVWTDGSEYATTYIKFVKTNNSYEFHIIEGPDGAIFKNVKIICNNAYCRILTSNKKSLLLSFHILKNKDLKVEFFPRPEQTLLVEKINSLENLKIPTVFVNGSILKKLESRKN
ncbi:hypothetical protein [Leptospira noguchii]|uniref:hypothetical protein n=1 Tax=Leptospira noguchii TaxID=28182 RepID=UPI0002E6640A|nr:hypothetical protein [Leptospira noguchii]AGS80639.1 hypothetical protein LEP1GSC059_0018 [Leptospira phage vB_LnoZ_CZ214-LE1]